MTSCSWSTHVWKTYSQPIDNEVARDGRLLVVHDALLVVERAPFRRSQPDHRVVLAAAPARSHVDVDLRVVDAFLVCAQRVAERHLAQEHAAVLIAAPVALRVGAVAMRLRARLREVEALAVA